MAREFNNIKVTVTDSGKIQVTIDPKDWINGEKLNISSTGRTYNVASTFGSHKLDGILNGLKLDIKLMAAKDEYDKRKMYLEQQVMAQKATEEFANNKEAQKALSNLGFDPAMLAQAIGLMQTMKAQAEATK